MSDLRIEERDWTDGSKSAKWINEAGETVAEVRVRRVLRSLTKTDEARYDVDVWTSTHDPADPPTEDSRMYEAHRMDATTRRPT